MSSAGQRGRAAISVLGLVAFVAGIPVVLLRVARARFGGAAPWHGVTPSGWTVPRALDSLTGRLTDATMVDVVIRVAVAIAWIATAVVVITVLLEAVHMRRYGLPRPRVRGFAWSQHLARTLAAGLLVLLPASGVGRASARTALESVRAQSSAAPVVLRAASSAESATDDSVADVVDDVYVVEVGDSIYGLAERLAGGDASRISAIATSLLDLNLGRTMPDGQRFLTAAYIEPGWTLQLPGRRPVPQPIGATSSGGHVVEPGETLSSIALDELADATRWEEIWSANAGRSMPDGRTFDDPNLIVPGWQLALPEATPTSAVTAPTPTRASVAVVEPIAPSTTSAPVTTAPEPDVEPTAPTAAPEPAPTAAPDRDAVADASQASPLGLEHAAMLGTGVLALVAAARRRRLRAAVPPSRLPVPSAESVVVERSLRVADAAERFLRLDLAVRAAAEPIVDAGRRVLAAAVGPPGDVVLWTDGGVELPAPWRPEGGTWLLPATVPVDDLADAARRGGCPCVALVQVGVAADGADVYVDLEAAAVLSIEGCPAQADAVLAAMAMTLAASPLAEVAHLVDVGLPPATFLGHRHHHRCVSVSDAVTTATSLVSPRREASTFELRVRGTSGELWEPAVVLVSSDRVAEIDEHAVGAACAHAVALVAGGPVDGARMRLAQQDRRWTLAPLGIELTPIGLTSSDIDTVAALAVEADRPIEPDTPGVVPVETGAGPEPRDWSLMVRVLGPVDVVDASGEPAPFEKSKARELVAWLALHTERPTRTGARTAMWDLDVRDATFANVVSEARRATARLVEPPGDDAWIRRTLTEELPLHPGIVTDAQLLADALHVARALPADEAVVVLERGVELVRGIPFEGTSYLWPDAEGITSDLVLRATSAAVELARLHLERNDVEGVFRATGRGLRVLAGHEELIALRMRAHARRGDLAGVRHEWESYERVIHADPWSDGEPAPKLLDLRRELLMRSA